MSSGPAERPAVGASTAAVRCVLGRLAARPSRFLVIDGPSGAGKSVLADAVLAGLPGRATLLRLDELYPGWHGLDAGVRSAARRVLAPLRRGRPGLAEGWDWATGGPAAPRGIHPGRMLVVEGCGAFAATGGVPDALRVWVDAPPETRRARALARDAGAFDDWWEVWDRQWRRHRAREHPRLRADLVVDGGRVQAGPHARRGSILGTTLVP